MTNKEYHERPELSASDLKAIYKSPAKWVYGKENKKETDVMRLGSAIHTKLLQPELYDIEIAVCPKINKRTKAGQEEYAEFLEYAKDRIVISFEQNDLVNEIETAALSNEAVKKLLYSEDRLIEETYFWKDRKTGIDCRCRPDLVTFKAGFDIKTTADASPEKFTRQIIDLGYDMQAAFYLDGLKANGINRENFAFIAIEKEPPYNIEIYMLDSEFLEYGRKRYEKALQKFIECTSMDEFYSYTADSVNVLKLPKWAK